METVGIRLVSSDEDYAVLGELMPHVMAEASGDPYSNEGDGLWWLITTNAGVVGVTGVHSIDWPSRRCRGIIWIDPRYRRMGCGYEACRQRNEELFDKWNMNRIEWAVLKSNVGSLAFSNARNYAHREGVLSEAIYIKGNYHDVVLFALTRRQRDLARSERTPSTNPGQGEEDCGNFKY